MDMPDDTPKKPNRIQSKDKDMRQSLQHEHEDDNFSSFESDDKNMDENESTNSTDSKGFKNMHIYKQKQMNFPQIPSNLGKLYQIYIQNVNRKLQMKKQIQQLITKQIKALRIAYDKQKFTIEQFIDLQQQSKQYKISKENYEKRQLQLQKLVKKYKQLKIMHVQSMMIFDPTMLNTLSKFIKKNKQIIYIQVLNDTVIVLCNQKYKLRKIGKFKNKKGTKKLINVNNGNSEQSVQDQVILTATKSRNASQAGSCSQDQDQNKIHHKFTLRNFKFFKTMNGVSFEPLQHFLQLPNSQLRNYKGFIIQPQSGQYIVYEQKKIYIFELIQKQFKIKQQLNFDSQILLCEILKNHLYCGTKDGIIKIYQIIKQKQYILNKIILCNYGNYQQITHYSLTNNPDIIIFVKNSTYLCQMNLSSYSSYLLSQLPQSIINMNNRLIITNNCIYTDYYILISGSNRGKAVLQHNQKLSKLSKNRKLIKIYHYQNSQYAIFYEQFGVFSVQCLDLVIKN